MGRRSRQRDATGRALAPEARKPRVRGEAAEELARAELEPLEPGEVPRVVRVGAVVAALIAVGNPILFAAGYEVQGGQARLSRVLIISAVMAVAAAGMWRGRYWAVLGFQALLALTCIFAFLSLMVASNVEAGVRSGAVLLAAGTLFWLNIRAMARIQMPDRPSRVSGHG